MMVGENKINKNGKKYGFSAVAILLFIGKISIR